MNEPRNSHVVDGVCGGEKVGEAPSRTAREELTAPVVGDMTCPVDIDSRFRAIQPSSYSAARQ